MGLYDRDYMREKNKDNVIKFNKSIKTGSFDKNKYIIAIIGAFIIGYILGKIT